MARQRLRFMNRHGLNLRRLEVGESATPVLPPINIKLSAAPSGTPEAGDAYINSAGVLVIYSGSAWIPAGSLLSADGSTLTMGTTSPVVLTQSADTLTLATGDTLAITSADKLTIDGVIVPAIQYASFQLKPFATVTEYDLWVMKRAITVVSIDCVPSTLQGGALTATVVKATGTATPANGTTPLHTANAINLNTGAYTNQSITLTATTADLTFAAGDRLGIDYSAAYTAGHAALTIGYKYV